MKGKGQGASGRFGKKTKSKQKNIFTKLNPRL